MVQNWRLKYITLSFTFVNECFCCHLMGRLGFAAVSLGWETANSIDVFSSLKNFRSVRIGPIQLVVIVFCFGMVCCYVMYHFASFFRDR